MARVNFILLSQPRSGSTFLMSNLVTSKHVFCDNELFNPLKICRHEAKNDNFNIIFRENNPLDFFDKYFTSDFSKQFDAIGFKFMLGHHVEILMKLLDDINIKIIFLKRTNKLALASSWFKALETQTWASFKETQHIEKLNFHYGKYIQKIRESETLDFLLERNLAGRDNLLRLNYTDLFNLSYVFDKISCFLEIKNDFRVSNILKKQGSLDILSRFKERDKVLEFLHSIKHNDWRTEERICSL